MMQVRSFKVADNVWCYAKEAIISTTGTCISVADGDTADFMDVHIEKGKENIKYFPFDVLKNW